MHNRGRIVEAIVAVVTFPAVAAVDAAVDAVGSEEGREGTVRQGERAEEDVEGVVEDVGDGEEKPGDEEAGDAGRLSGGLCRARHHDV